MTGLASKSRAVLESAQNFEEDEVVFVPGTPIFDPILSNYFPKRSKISTNKVMKINRKPLVALWTLDAIKYLIIQSLRLVNRQAKARLGKVR